MTPEVREGIGPFRVQSVLGQGATGTVYRCLDDCGQSIAVKVPRQGREPQWRLEVATLTRLAKRGVPGIVQILGVGSGSDAWYSMALASGASLREVLQRRQSSSTSDSYGQTAPVGQGAVERHQISASAKAPSTAGSDMDLPSLLQAMARIAATLSHLHAAGVAHGDLKPENIVFGRDRQPVLIDFGSASVSMREDLREASVAPAQPWMTAGYIAPEIRKGEPVTPRSDLFALGCVLFEILSGRLPGRNSAPLLLWPDTTSEHASAEVRHLVEGLLQPNPSQRAYFAADVADALRHLGPPPTPATLPILPRPLHRPQHVGRAAALQLMVQALRDLPERPGGLILVEGESGIGKTRLLTELLTLGQGFSLRFIVARAENDASNGTSPGLLGPLRQALREAALERPAPPFVQAVIGEPSSDPDGLAQQAQAEAYRAMLWLAEARPLVLVVDDVDTTGDGTRGLLDALTIGTMRSILVIASCQSRSSDGPLRDLFGSCRERIVLTRLPEDELQALLRDALATPHLPSSLARLIFERSAGNPCYALEFGRAALDAGTVRRSGNSWVIAEGTEPSSSVPATLAQALLERYQRLSLQAQTLLRMVSILGAQPPVVLLSLTRSAFDMDPSIVEAAFDELLQSGTVRQANDSHCEIEHPILNEFLRAHITPAEQARIHRLVATWLEQEQTRDGRDFAAQLGAHWLGAGEPERALEHLVRAGSRYSAQHELRRSERCFVQAAACIDAISSVEPARATGLASTALHVWEAIADARAQLGWFDEATAALRRVFESTDDRLRRARALRRWGSLLMSKSQLEEAEEKYAAALHQLGTADPLSPEHMHEWRDTQLLRIENVYYQRDTARMRELVEQLGPALRQGSTVQGGKLALCTANLLFQEAGFFYTPTAGEQWLQAIGLLGESPSEQPAAAFGRVDLGMAMLFGPSEDWQPASQHLAEGVRAADRLSDLKLLARGRAYLATASRRLKRLPETESEARLCVTTAEACQIAAYVAVGWGNLGWVAVMQGDDVGAITLAERALALWRSLEVNYPMQWIAAFPLLAALEGANPIKLAAPLALLLDPKQLPLPGELASSLRTALDTGGTARSDATRAALVIAHRLGFM